MLPGNIKLNTSTDKSVCIEQLVGEFNPHEELTIQSYNITRKSMTHETVTMTRSTSCKDFVLLEFEDQSNLIITPDHQIYQPDTGEWVRSSHIKCGTNVLTPAGQIQLIKAHTIRNNMSERVYNLNLTGHSCYFANNVLIKC